MIANRAPSALSWLFILGSALTCSCSSNSDQTTSDPTVQSSSATTEPIAEEEVMVKQITYSFAVYYLPEPTNDPIAALSALLKDSSTSFHLVEKIPEHTSLPCVSADLKRDLVRSYPPPDLQALHYFGRGVSREQAESLQQSKAVLLLEFTYGKEHLWEGLRSAIQLVDSIASSTDGLIWDAETREMFTPTAWKERRMDDWTDPVPNISKHVTIHAYRKEEYIRAITLGMAKFGLPDIVVENFSWSRNNHIGLLINLFAQATAEGATPKVPGQFDLDIRAIRNSYVRESQLESLKSNATAIAPLSLTLGVWEEGDPMNRLIGITFDRCPGPDLHARQEFLLSNLFGSEDSAVAVKHNDEIEAASRRARMRLPSLREQFNKGLAPGEFIYVKAPFQTPDGGHEWMWVEVSSWQGEIIRGLLGNDPVEIPDLHAGQDVSVSESDVFDYIRQDADGNREGNETGALIQTKSKSN